MALLIRFLFWSLVLFRYEHLLNRHLKQCFINVKKHLGFCQKHSAVRPRAFFFCSKICGEECKKERYTSERWVVSVRA